MILFSIDNIESNHFEVTDGFTSKVPVFNKPNANDEARMAATSQAHDEARHYYVMKDYLQLLGHVPESIDKHADEFLESILRADTTAKMLLGMQLMVEPMALTLLR